MPKTHDGPIAGHRGILAQLTAGLLAAVLMWTLATPAHADNLDQELRDTNRELVDARRDLEGIREDIGDAAASLDEIDRRLASLSSQQASLQAELDDARSGVEKTELELERTTERLDLTRAHLADARAELDEQQAQVTGRLTSIYMYGTASYGQALVASDDFSELLRSTYYVGRVVEEDQNILDQVARVADELREANDELTRLEERLVGQERLLEGSLEEVARVADAHDAIVGLVEAQRVERARVLQALRSQEGSYEKLVGELEAESRRIAALLATSKYSGGAPGSGELLWPTSGRPGSPFGYRVHPIFGTRRLHTGVDIGAPSGQKIVAAATGLVVSSGWRGGYGQTVVIDHGGGIATLYAHQSRLGVSKGEIVAAGQTIGYIGSTGNSTGPHLHFEVRKNGAPVNPMSWY